MLHQAAQSGQETAETDFPEQGKERRNKSGCDVSNRFLCFCTAAKPPIVCGAGKIAAFLKTEKPLFLRGGNEGKRKKDGYASRNRRIIHG